MRWVDGSTAAMVRLAPSRAAKPLWCRKRSQSASTSEPQVAFVLPFLNGVNGNGADNVTGEDVATDLVANPEGAFHVDAAALR